MCTHTCTCTSASTLHRVRELRARPFSITPPCIGSRTPSSEGVHGGDVAKVFTAGQSLAGVSNSVGPGRQAKGS